MSQTPLSTIAQLLFAEPQALNFARIVGEFETVLTRLRGDRLRVTWDCEDVVTLDLSGTRIVLAWNEAPGQGEALLVAVGPDADHGLQSVPDVPHPAHDLLCSRLVERIQSRHPADAILWHQAPGPVTADLVDALFDSIPAVHDLMTEVAMAAPAMDAGRVADAPAPQTPGPFPRLRLRRSSPMSAHPARPLTAPAPPANDCLPTIGHSDPDLIRLRAALYPEEEAVEVSVQMRLAVHTMNATLIMVWMPLGAAVMTYSLLRGENVRLSARLMALTGTAVGLAQTPFATQMAAMAGAF